MRMANIVILDGWIIYVPQIVELPKSGISVEFKLGVMFGGAKGNYVMCKAYRQMAQDIINTQPPLRPGDLVRVHGILKARKVRALNKAGEEINLTFSEVIANELFTLKPGKRWSPGEWTDAKERAVEETLDSPV